MDIHSINKRHFLKHSYHYRLEYDLSSRLINYENCILYIEVSIGEKWQKPPYKAALEVANSWKKTHPELNNALGAKIFILDNNSSDVKPKIKYKKGILFNFWNKN